MSEEEKTERVARAIYEAYGPDGDPICVYIEDSIRIDARTKEELRKQVMDVCRDAAVAAITALKEEGQGSGANNAHMLALAAFAKEVILAIWGAHRNNADLDGSDVLEEAERHGVIVLRPDDAEGNDAFELAPWLSRIQKEEGQATLRSAPIATGNNGWRPIVEAPKDGTEILACWAASRIYSIIQWAMDDGWWMDADDLTMVSSPTHWQPLPSPPIPETEKNDG